jgi:regulation of enolase protein 1 (concanavalin A-like superfamily)
MSSSSIGLDTLQLFAPAATYTIENERLTIQAPAEVDWWRNPEPVKVNRRDGTFAYLEIDGSKSFECEVWLRSDLKDLYDQACMVLHGGDFGDEWAHWLKTGTETFEERQWIKCVSNHGGIVDCLLTAAPSSLPLSVMSLLCSRRKSCPERKGASGCTSA